MRKSGERFGGVVSKRTGPMRISCFGAAQHDIRRLCRMPDGNEILIGHCFDVRCCFSCGCDFWLCPIVPDKMSAGSGKAESDLVDYELL